MRLLRTECVYVGSDAGANEHVGLRVHHLVHNRLEKGPGELPHVEEPVAVSRECCKVSLPPLPFS